MCNNKEIVKAEALGTFILMFCSFGTSANTGFSILPSGISYGAAFISCAYSFDENYIPHLNPAVSFAYLLLGYIDCKSFLFYLISQILGGFIGGYIVLLFPYLSYELGFDQSNDYGYSDAANGMLMFADRYFSVGATFGALLTEIILTMIFIFVFLNAYEQGTKHRKYSGFIVASMYSAVNFAGLMITGCSVNPIRSFSSALTQLIFFDSRDALTQLWIFIIGPILGALLAAYFYKFLNINKYETIQNTIHTVPIK